MGAADKPIRVRPAKREDAAAIALITTRAATIGSRRSRQSLAQPAASSGCLPSEPAATRAETPALPSLTRAWESQHIHSAASDERRAAAAAARTRLTHDCVNVT